jgi:hypothetical protein
MIRVLVLTVALAAGGGMLPLRVLQPVGAVAAQDDEEEVFEESEVEESEFEESEVEESEAEESEAEESEAEESEVEESEAEESEVEESEVEESEVEESEVEESEVEESEVEESEVEESEVEESEVEESEVEESEVEESEVEESEAAESEAEESEVEESEVEESEVEESEVEESEVEESEVEESEVEESEAEESEVEESEVEAPEAQAAGGASARGEAALGEGDGERVADDWSDEDFAEELDAIEGNDFPDDEWAGAFGPDDAGDEAIPPDEAWDVSVEWEVTEVVEVESFEAGVAADTVGVGEILGLGPGATARGASASRSAAQGRASRTAPAAGASQATRRAAAPPAGRSAAQPRAAAAPGAPPRAARASGGRPVAARAVPWQAQIYNPKVLPDPSNPRPDWLRAHHCSGALIASDWVVTAAHCVDPRQVTRDFRVRLGSDDLSRGDGATYRIERIVRHSQYRAGNRDASTAPNMYANDIALIRIVADGASRPRDPARIREIALNRAPLAGGTPVTATGWGAVASGTEATSAAMLRADLRVMDNAVCQQRPGYAAPKIHGKVFCAAHPTRSTCRADSGGPVVLTLGRPVLVGLVSWGRQRCAGDGMPGVYTRIDQYVGWIEQAMRLPPGRDMLP